MSSREGMRLTADAQYDRDDFESSYFGGCSCCISPPCSYCVHPGNPHNQDDFDECWEFEDWKAEAFDKLDELWDRIYKELK